MRRCVVGLELGLWSQKNRPSKPAPQMSRFTRRGHENFHGAMASSRTKRATVVKVSNEDSLRADLLIAEAELKDPKLNPQRRRVLQKVVG